MIALALEYWQPLLALLGAAAAFFAGRRGAQRTARLEQAEAANHASTERARADNAVARNPDPVGELRRDWQRP